jgi:hypothetical protein
MIVLVLEYKKPSPGANGARGQCSANLHELVGVHEAIRVGTVQVDLLLADLGDAARVVH